MRQKSSTSPPFNHGSHNYKACNAIDKLQEFNDWVITTAFYSALKFLEDKLFPGDFPHPRKHGDTSNYKTFAGYIADFGRLNGSNKHKEMLNLVQNHISNEEVVNSYEDLKQSCWTARYINYEVGTQRVELAKEALETIKNHCA